MHFGPPVGQYLNVASEREIGTNRIERKIEICYKSRERKSYKGKQRLMKGNTELWRQRNGYKK